jgi:hypothetical protein
MAVGAHMGSVEENITVTMKDTVDFGWRRSSSSSLHHLKLVDGIVRNITSIVIL